MGLFAGLDIKHLKKCLAQSKCYINIIVIVLIFITYDSRESSGSIFLRMLMVTVVEW